MGDPSVARTTRARRLRLIDELLADLRDRGDVDEHAKVRRIRSRIAKGHRHGRYRTNTKPIQARGLPTLRPIA
jgi:hypothetical protein